MTARWRQSAYVSVPFAVSTALAWVLMPVGSSIRWTEYWMATATLLVSGLFFLAARRGRRRPLVLVALLVFLAAAGLLRDAGDGVFSGAGVLTLVAVFYAALTCCRRDLTIVLAATGAFYLVPMFLVGGADYPPSQYRTALLSVIVSGTIGYVAQSLVARAEEQTAQAQARGRMLEQVAQVARSLLDSPRVRDDLCVAVERIADAAVALLFEPLGGQLRCTAMTLPTFAESHRPAAPGSPVEVALRGGHPVYIDTDLGSKVASVELWEASGRPSTALYEPLLHAGEALGVLVVAWSRPVPADGSHRRVVELLAHEAAGVIARADTLEDLADAAQTDPLTGLPNRRAWDAALEAALASGDTVTLAMFDLDHFKQFNDEFGHPAGDRLLKSCAAAWRAQLRGDDLLARLGGEEFGLLICGGPTEIALEVVERLRIQVPEGQTCSAGLAVLDGAESGEALVARADAALYEAKSGGRDRTQLSLV